MIPQELSLQTHLNQAGQAKQLAADYQLKIIICRTGNTTNSGHFYTYTWDSKIAKWFKNNDGLSVEILDTLPEEDAQQNAYLVFYELKNNQTKIKIIPADSIANAGKNKTESLGFSSLFALSHS